MRSHRRRNRNWRCRSPRPARHRSCRPAHLGWSRGRSWAKSAERSGAVVLDQVVDSLTTSRVVRSCGPQRLQHQRLEHQHCVAGRLAAHGPIRARRRHVQLIPASRNRSKSTTSASRPKWVIRRSSSNHPRLPRHPHLSAVIRIGLHRIRLSAARVLPVLRSGRPPNSKLARRSSKSGSFAARLGPRSTGFARQLYRPPHS